MEAVFSFRWATAGHLGDSFPSGTSWFSPEMPSVLSLLPLVPPTARPQARAACTALHSALLAVGHSQWRRKGKGSPELQVAQSGHCPGTWPGPSLPSWGAPTSAPGTTSEGAAGGRETVPHPRAQAAHQPGVWVPRWGGKGAAPGLARGPWETLASPAHPDPRVALGAWAACLAGCSGPQGPGSVWGHPVCPSVPAPPLLPCPRWGRSERPPGWG